jgi:hypothetical protein
VGEWCWQLQVHTSSWLAFLPDYAPVLTHRPAGGRRLPLGDHTCRPGSRVCGASWWAGWQAADAGGAHAHV